MENDYENKEPAYESSPNDSHGEFDINEMNPYEVNDQLLKHEKAANEVSMDAVMNPDLLDKSEIINLRTTEPSNNEETKNAGVAAMNESLVLAEHYNSKQKNN